MEKRKRRKILSFNTLIIFIFFIFVLNFFGCSTTITEVKFNPEKYNGKKVDLVGKVTEIYKMEIEATVAFNNKITIFKLEDEGDYVYVLTTNEVILNSYRKSKGKLFYLKNKNESDEIQLFYRYLYAYLDEKGFLGKKTEKSEQFFMWHFIKFLINVLTDSKFNDKLNDFDDAVLYAIENQPEKKEAIEDALNKILFNLPEHKRIVILFEDNYELY